ncbi:hypothetical protein KFL_010330010 [Klebsormidium nitens]|uniref:Uncharacterized protein n=1 Tax=Klebsormidium nitens TaxID=105231 RepID=A0A1Y1IPC5_KLENI|nr:hypothetical protein KFL_010330010 [Klebsormidium nitens]|eukprot:GAQ92503.1 hypothetical protein KFL_010330010 [Klebsormidium nitens]
MEVTGSKGVHAPYAPAAWAADQELRRLKAKLRRLEQELRDLGGATEDAPSAPAFAAGQESGSTTDWVSMPKSRSLIATLLLRGGVESNPGPTSQEEKELAWKKSWQDFDPDIDPDLLDYLAKEQLSLARWRGTPKDDRPALLSGLQKEYPGPGKWLNGWTAILNSAAAWAADQELRRLKAKLRRLEQELRDLGGAAEDAPSAPAFAAGQESGSTTDWVSMPKSRSLIATLLLRGGVESNPGPTSQEEKEVALKKGWQAVDSDIDSDLLEHLANQQLTVDRWRGMSDDGRSKLLDRLERGYPGPGNWLLGWNAIFDKAAGKQPPLSDE